VTKAAANILEVGTRIIIKKTVSQIMSQSINQSHNRPENQFITEILKIKKTTFFNITYAQHSNTTASGIPRARS